MIGRAGPNTSSMEHSRFFVDVNKNSRRIEISFARRTRVPGENSGTSHHRVIDLRFDLRASGVCVQRSRRDPLVPGHCQFAVSEPLPRVLQQTARRLCRKGKAVFTAMQAWPQLKNRPTAAALTASSIIRVIADNHRVASTEFECDALHGLRRQFA